MGKCECASPAWHTSEVHIIGCGFRPIRLWCWQVFAPTFPGYGRAEKPALAYSQELWRDFLRDFVLEVMPA